MNYTPEEISILERQSIAKNPKTPKNVLKELANDPEKNVRLFVAANVNTPKTVLTKLASVEPRYVATNPNTPATVLRQLAKTYPEYVVSNSNAPESLLAKLAESPSVIDRYYLAANPQAPVSVLRKLAENEESPLVLENVAWNPNAPEDLLANIREQGEKWAIVTEIDPYLEVEQIGNDYQIACHINTSLTTLEKLANHENWIVRYLVINNPNTPKSLADAIVSEIAQTQSLPEDSRKCLVLNMLNKMPSHIPFLSSNGLPIIAIADEIVDFRWHYFEGDSFIFYNNTQSRVIGVLQKGEFQENVNEDKIEEVCRIVGIEDNDFQPDADLREYHNHLLKDELAANFVYLQRWVNQQGFLFTPYPSDFLKICHQGNYDNDDEDYWRLDGSYFNTAKSWLYEYLEYINDWYITEAYTHIFDENNFNEIVGWLHELAATHEEHSRHGLFFWDYTAIKNPYISRLLEDRNPVFERDTFCCNPEYDIQSMLENLQQDSGLTTQDELKATISRLLVIAPLAYDEDEIVAVLAKHQDLVIEVSGLQIVSNSDQIDENNEYKVYFYYDDSCTDYNSFVAKQDWDSLFPTTEGNKLLAYMAYLIIKIILFDEASEKGNTYQNLEDEDEDEYEDED